MDVTDRIIDANLNRAREALRVMEDLARFVLDDAELTERTKAIRHDLVEMLRRIGCDHARLTASRNIEEDVGSTICTDTEGSRDGLIGIAAAAAGRLTEALRSIEECSKTLPGVDHSSFEDLRYRAYEIDRALSQRLPVRSNRQWRLAVLVSEELCTHCPWQEVVLTSLAAGADCIQLREKTLNDAELLHRARVLVGLAREVDAEIVINDRADIAVAAGADALHLGQTDIPIDDALRVVGRRLRVGISITNLAQAHLAIERGADYIGVGPMFPSTTKPDLITRGVELLEQVLDDDALRDRPHLAIGGISLDNIDQLVELGCQGVAVSSAVCSAADPGKACSELLERIPALEVDDSQT